jgi:class 3 adenylate cyclase
MGVWNVGPVARQAAIPDVVATLQTRIGIATGLVVVGDLIGSETRRQFRH